MLVAQSESTTNNCDTGIESTTDALTSLERKKEPYKDIHTPLKSTSESISNENFYYHGDFTKHETGFVYQVQLPKLIEDVYNTHKTSVDIEVVDTFEATKEVRFKYESKDALTSQSYNSESDSSADEFLEQTNANEIIVSENYCYENKDLQSEPHADIIENNKEGSVNVKQDQLTWNVNDEDESSYFKNSNNKSQKKHDPDDVSNETKDTKVIRSDISNTNGKSVNHSNPSDDIHAVPHINKEENSRSYLSKLTDDSSGSDDSIDEELIIINRPEKSKNRKENSTSTTVSITELHSETLVTYAENTAKPLDDIKLNTFEQSTADSTDPSDNKSWFENPGKFEDPFQRYNKIIFTYIT